MEPNEPGSAFDHELDQLYETSTVTIQSINGSHADARTISRKKFKDIIRNKMEEAYYHGMMTASQSMVDELTV